MVSGGPEKDRFLFSDDFEEKCAHYGTRAEFCLTTEAVEGAALTFERIDNVHGGDGLPLGVLSVRDSVTNNVFQENLEHTAGLFVDETGDTFDTTAASQTADSRLRDALDVVAKNFAMTLSATLSQTLASFTTARHFVMIC